MALKGEAKRGYQREYMRKRRGVRPSPLEQVLDPHLIDLLDNVAHPELDLLDPPTLLDPPIQTQDRVVGVLAGVRPDNEGYYPAWAITNWVKFNGKVRTKPLPHLPDGRGLV